MYQELCRGILHGLLIASAGSPSCLLAACKFLPSKSSFIFSLLQVSYMLSLCSRSLSRNSPGSSLKNQRMKSDEAAVGIVTLFPTVIRLYDQRIGLFGVVSGVVKV